MPIVSDAWPLPFPPAEPSVMGMPHTAERWTADRVRALPDDGNRYELVSGELLVTPAPRPQHQIAVFELEKLLDRALAGTGLGRVLHSPADISLGEDEVLQPDLFVYRTAPGQPLEAWTDIVSLQLVVEILSPSTARYDRHLKRLRYQRAGVPEYWVVDLDARLVERWRAGDDRPEILAERLAWQPPGADAAVELDLPAYFRSLTEAG